jgi:hypothetical protein
MKGQLGIPKDTMPLEVTPQSVRILPLETLARWLRKGVHCLVNILPQRASIIELFKPTLYYLTPVFIAPRVILSGVKLR